MSVPVEGVGVAVGVLVAEGLLVLVGVGDWVWLPSVVSVSSV